MDENVNQFEPVDTRTGNPPSTTSSYTKLPQLPRTYQESEEESKLMEDIRKVENRIKEVKYERSQFAAHRSNFEALRPFL